MAAAWIEAVRNLWVKDEEIDFRKLEAKWQLRTFESGGGEPTSDGTLPESRGLLCSLTGSDDPDERQRIVDQIQSNGGTYMGDLTKRITHLIVFKAEGRKYQAARNWGIRTVSVEWVSDSIARGMILDEKCYDPILPPEQRGVGAWNKNAIVERRISLGKRSRDGSTAGQDDGGRKLRKTASMKLTSQREDLWGDILGKAEPAGSSVPAAPTVPAQPMPSLQRSLGSKSMDTQNTRLSSFGASEEGRVFASCGFYVRGFSEQKTAVVISAVSSLGGLICTSLDEVIAASGAQLTHRFMVVPQTSAADTLPRTPEGIHVITEFYIERCMHKKYFFDPDQHVFGRPFPVFPLPGFANLTVCTAGFSGVDLNHMDKALRQLGAKYEERFTADASLLLCSALSAVRQEKLQLAVAWKVPVVSAEWLWECISTGSNVPIMTFLFSDLKQNISHPKRIEAGTGETKAKRKLDRSTRDMLDEDLFPGPAVKPAPKPKSRHDGDAAGFSSTPNSSKPAANTNTTATEYQRHIPANEQDSMTTHFETAPTHQLHLSTGSSAGSSAGRSGSSAPLSETTPNALNRPSPAPRQQPPRKPLARVFSEVADSDATDGEASLSSHPQPEHEIEPEVGDPEGEEEKEDPEEVKRRAEAEKIAAERIDLSTKLANSLFDSALLDGGPSRPEGLDSLSSRGATTRRRKREVLGRAVSNVSVASSASGNGGESSEASDTSLLGSINPAPAAEVEAPPPGTQITYEDPEADLAKARLKEKLGGKPIRGDTAARGQERVTFSDLGVYDQPRQSVRERRSRRK